MRILGLSLASLLISTGIAAQEGKQSPEWRSWPLGQRLTLGVSAYRPNIDTRVSLEAGPIRGTFDFESDLGLAEIKNLPVADLRWRFFKRHSLRIDYFALNRSSFTSEELDLQLCLDPDNPGDCKDINESLGAGTFVDTVVLNIAYDYSIIFNERMNLSVGIGLSAQEFTLGVNAVLEGDTERVSTETEFLAPLPTLAMAFNYAITNKWIADFTFNWLKVTFDLEDSGDFEGRILGLDAGIRWQTWKYVGFALRYTLFDLKLDVDDGEDFGGTVEYRYSGPRLGINAYF